MFGYVEDTTVEFESRAREQSRLVTVESWLRSLPDAVVVARAGRIEAANREAESLLGANVVAGAPVLGLVHVSAREVLSAHARSNSDVEAAVVRLRGSEERYVEVCSRDMDGTPDVRVLVFRDVTARLQAEHRAETAERLASVGRLAAGVAHEINNPLAYVNMNLELLYEGLAGLTLPPPMEQDVRERLEDAITGARRITEIVSQLRLYANARSAHPTGGRVSEAVELADQLSRFAIARGIQVQTKIPVNIQRVAMPVGSLSQVLINLVVNANDAILETGRTEGRVVISAVTSPKHVRLFVQDDGPGIPESTWHTVFEPYFTTKEPGKGTGMGLSIVRTLVHEAGGTISLRKVPSGTCFEVCLPYWDESEFDEESTSELSLDEARRRRLLIVDDEPAMVRAISRTLSKTFDIKHASNGMEAKQHLESGYRPDIILCDVVMPQMDGQQFNEWLGSYDPGLQGQMVMMTGGTLSAERADFLRQAGRPVLSKPLSLDRLKETMAQVEADMKDKTMVEVTAQDPMVESVPTEKPSRRKRRRAKDPEQDSETPRGWTDAHNGKPPN